VSRKRRWSPGSDAFTRNWRRKMEPEPDFDLFDEVDRLVYADWLAERGRHEEEAHCRGGRCLIRHQGRVVPMTIWHLDDFTNAYVEAALWSSTDEGGEPLDEHYGQVDMAPECLDQMIRDCRDFQREMNELYSDNLYNESGAGHDFWLTRNHHGTGFWDGDWEHVEELTRMAHAYGSCDLYVGDDDKIYCQ
jgi:uncharacterized protein (TIGR02996 family)